MKKILCPMLLCAQFYFAPVELDVLAAFSGKHKATITVSDENTPQEVRKALNRAFDIPAIIASQVCPFEYEFLVDTLPLDELTIPLTGDQHISYVHQAGREILIMPVFPNSNVSMAIIGHQIRKNFRHIFHGSTPVYKDEGELNNLLSNSNIQSWAECMDDGWITQPVHELSMHTKTVLIIQENYLHNLTLIQEPKVHWNGNGDEFWGAKSWPALGGGRVYKNEFSIHVLLDNLMATIKVTNGRAPLEPFRLLPPGIRLDLDRPITQDDLDRYDQPWKMRAPKRGDYTYFLPQPARQVLPQVQISHTQYITNLLQRFAQLICPNT